MNHERDNFGIVNIFFEVSDRIQMKISIVF